MTRADGGAPSSGPHRHGSEASARGGGAGARSGGGPASLASESLSSPRDGQYSLSRIPL